MKTKILTLIVASILVSVSGFAQFNKLNNAKDMKNNIENSTPSQDEANKHEENKECLKLVDRIDMSIIHGNNSIADGDYNAAEKNISKAKLLIDELDSEGCNVNINKQISDLQELEDNYNNKNSGAEVFQANMNDDLEYVKQCVWNLDPLKMQIDAGSIGMLKDLSEAELFYTNCKDINFINNAPDIVKISKRYPEEFQPDYEMTGYLEDYTMKFPKYLEEQLDYFKNEINNAMIEGNKLKARHENFLGDAMDMAYAAVITGDGCMILYPNNKEIAKLRETAFANYQSIAKEYAAKTYTSELHAQNAGKVVFSNSPINIGSEDAASFKTSFGNDETVYSMMYLKSNLSSIQGTGFISTRIYANGTQIAEHEWKASTESTKETFNEAEIMPTPANAETYGALKFYEAFSTSLLPGENTIKVCLLDADNNIVAEGEFTLDCSNGTEDITKRYKELKAIRLEKVRMPEAKMINPELEHSIIAAMPAQNWPETAIRAVITGDSWITHRGALGEILFREIYAAVAFKTPEGTCKIFYMSFKQAYNGSTYGITKYYSVGGSEEIKCENVNK